MGVHEFPTGSSTRSIWLGFSHPQAPPLKFQQYWGVICLPDGSSCNEVCYRVSNCSLLFEQMQNCHVKSGEADGYPKTEDMLVDEETLQRNLGRAIQEEDYARAAKIRDDLRILHEDNKASLLAASAWFYNAFKNGDLAAMYSIWAKGDHVYVVHPDAGWISGYDVVMQSWEMVCDADYEFPLNIDLIRGQVATWFPNAALLSNPRDPPARMDRVRTADGSLLPVVGYGDI